MPLTSRRAPSRVAKRSRTALRIAAILCIAGAIPFGTTIYSSAVRGLNPFTAWACTSEKRGGLNNVSGWDLEIEHTSCDLFSKEDAISVYASPAGSHIHWFTRRALLFRYLPGSPDDLLPSFESTGPDRLLITVPSVSSIGVQRYSIDQTAVNYHIGHIEYPDPGRLTEAH